MNEHFKASPNGANERVWPIASPEADTLTHAFYAVLRHRDAGFDGEYSEHDMSVRAANGALEDTSGRVRHVTTTDIQNITGAPYHYPLHRRHYDDEPNYPDMGDEL